MTSLRVGCPMWANRDWVGSVLPPGTPQGAELAEYAKVLGAVEGNTTFYALPDASTARRWRESVPDDFRFCFKLPKVITHDRRLRGCDEELAVFLRSLEPLHEVMGPSSIQLPASFGPDDLGALDAFLDSVPHGLDWAVEVRHAAFFAGGDMEGPLDELLRRHRADRVIFDTRALFDGPADTVEEIEAFRNKPRVPVRPTRTADAPVVRFLGQSDDAVNPGYWEKWVAKLAAWCDDDAQPYLFFHTPDNSSAPQQALAVQNAVAAMTETVPPVEVPDFDRTLFTIE